MKSAFMEGFWRGFTNTSILVMQVPLMAAYLALMLIGGILIVAAGLLAAANIKLGEAKQ